MLCVRTRWCLSFGYISSCFNFEDRLFEHVVFYFLEERFLSKGLLPTHLYHRACLHRNRDLFKRDLIRSEIHPCTTYYLTEDLFSDALCGCHHHHLKKRAATSLLHQIDALLRIIHRSDLGYGPPQFLQFFAAGTPPHRLGGRTWHSKHLHDCYRASGKAYLDRSLLDYIVIYNLLPEKGCQALVCENLMSEHWKLTLPARDYYRPARKDCNLQQ